MVRDVVPSHDVLQH